MDLITEEVATHFALERLLDNDTLREQLYDRIIELGKTNKRLQQIIDQRIYTYGNRGKRTKEEEVIAGFFVDYEGARRVQKRCAEDN